MDGCGGKVWVGPVHALQLHKAVQKHLAGACGKGVGWGGKGWEGVGGGMHALQRTYGHPGPVVALQYQHRLVHTQLLARPRPSKITYAPGTHP